MPPVARRIVQQWHHPTLAGQILLRPVSWLFALLIVARRAAYGLGLKRTRRPPMPVIVVGNLTVGGSGKTPLVGYLVERLAAAGWQPGIVSRGYGRDGARALRVGAETTVAEAGDEPLLLYQRTQRPVAVGADRASAVALLDDCDVVVADDGLQHYALARDLEIAVIDGESGLGNGRLLPAGPLREPQTRLAQVDFVAVRDGEWPRAWRFRVCPGEACRLTDGVRCRLDAWHDTHVHAVAAIGVPERFFGQLEDAGLEVTRHGFPDHHALQPADVGFDDGDPILMTEKDAVKCRAFADDRMWAVAATVEDRDGLGEAVCARLQATGRNRGSPTS